MDETLINIRKISNRLALCLAILIVVIITGALVAFLTAEIITAPFAVFAAGIIGGFVGLQRRLKDLSNQDLTLLANSWIYICLSPLVGGVLAVVLYVLFISGLLSGDMFPVFQRDYCGTCSGTINSFKVIFCIRGDEGDYAKMLFWSFVAGFSERFVTDIISKFENSATNK